MLLAEEHATQTKFEPSAVDADLPGLAAEKLPTSPSQQHEKQNLFPSNSPQPLAAAHPHFSQSGV